MGQGGGRFGWRDNSAGLPGASQQSSEGKQLEPTDVQIGLGADLPTCPLQGDGLPAGRPSHAEGPEALARHEQEPA
eukprot:scaffold291854_cov46-Prasinocladus_malaysianus.AAC.1